MPARHLAVAFPIARTAFAPKSGRFADAGALDAGRDYRGAVGRCSQRWGGRGPCGTNQANNVSLLLPRVGDIWDQPWVCLLTLCPSTTIIVAVTGRLVVSAVVLEKQDSINKIRM